MSSAGSARTSDEELMVLVWLVFIALASAGTLATVMWQTTLAWALAHQVLVPRTHHPLLALPYSAGAGLDLPRLLITAAAALAVVALSAGAIIRRLRAGDPR